MYRKFHISKKHALQMGRNTLNGKQVLETSKTSILHSLQRLHGEFRRKRNKNMQASRSDNPLSLNMLDFFDVSAL